MFGARSASVGPPRAAQPNVGSLLYRGKLGGRVGRDGREREEREESGKRGKGGKRGKVLVTPGIS